MIIDWLEKGLGEVSPMVISFGACVLGSFLLPKNVALGIYVSLVTILLLNQIFILFIFDY